MQPSPSPHAAPSLVLLPSSQPLLYHAPSLSRRLALALRARAQKPVRRHQYASQAPCAAQRLMLQQEKVSVEYVYVLLLVMMRVERKEWFDLVGRRQEGKKQRPWSVGFSVRPLIAGSGGVEMSYTLRWLDSHIEPVFACSEISVRTTSAGSVARRLGGTACRHAPAVRARPAPCGLIVSARLNNPMRLSPRLVPNSRRPQRRPRNA